MPFSEASRAALITHLTGLSVRQLAELTAVRPELTAAPAPRTPAKRAERLLDSEAIELTCSVLTLPGLQVAEAVAALGDGWTMDRLAALLGVPENDAALRTTVAHLSERTLIWPIGGGFAAGHLDVMWPNPLGLGAGAAEMLNGLATAQLREMAQDLGVTAGRLKGDVVAALTAWLSIPDNVRGVVEQAPAEVRRRLQDVALEPVDLYTFNGFAYGGVVPAPPWATQRGLMVQAGWGSGGRMPREVALALRGADYHAPFDGEAPALPAVTVAAEAVARDAAAAATETLAAVTAVLETISKAPVATLKTGGLGVRELRRIVKAAGHTEDRTRLTLELAAAGGLIAVQDTVTVSEAYDDYATMAPGGQVLDTVETWLEMPACPLAPGRPGDPAERAIYWDANEHAILTALRTALLRTVVATVPEGRAVTADDMAAQIAWRFPALAEAAGYDLGRFLTGIWREAHAIGLLAHGTPTVLCRLLLAGSDEPGDETATALRAQADAMVPATRATALLQNDLTAVATGTPSAALLALLDSAADPESRSGAWTWRFSPASVLRAVDAGIEGADLLARLRQVAEGGRFPQPLTYLIEDTVRRHGRVQVRPVGCCLCSDDEPLLTEILHTKSLRALALNRLAPTVLASAKPQAETLTALRAAGFAPAGVRADGTPAIERLPRHRAPSR
ncbi:helicase-associated domain-containing protein [Actinoplanes awajinensis]|uniref:Helicase XPB/Ssl2 N-terminal domain-containing protein n=1 Tax=Actinoplanes awajinensis subsp. mycoplanecinus TaxID=135947 RepID=A0A101JLM9_9ACTN|nr:helicase-associated domain-containing protein [Actinoplanes awajinensis]KUL29180.1 hypothetical protein ADL15_28895 [Actinoplanes awajinensis subsp. mycoplanecinus]